MARPRAKSPSPALSTLSSSDNNHNEGDEGMRMQVTKQDFGKTKGLKWMETLNECDKGSSSVHFFIFVTIQNISYVWKI